MDRVVTDAFERLYADSTELDEEVGDGRYRPEKGIRPLVISG